MGKETDSASPPPPLPETRSAAVAVELRRLILSGEFSVGRRLRQVEISQRFGVSTTPVREAFTALAKEGLVEQDAHRGVKVILPRQEDLLENYEIRMLLEPLATEHAAANLSEDQLDAIERELDRMKAAEADSRPLEDDLVRADANREFHRIIYEAADRPHLAELIQRLRNSANVFQRLAATQPPADYKALAAHEHAAILASLRARDGDQAAKVMKNHLQHNLEHISKALAALALHEDAAGDGDSKAAAALDPNA